MENLYLIFGEEQYVIDYELNKFKSGDVDIRNAERIANDDIAWLNTFSIFAAKKILHVSIPELKADDGLLKTLKNLKALQFPLVITCKKVNERTKLFKWLKKEAIVIPAKRLNENQFREFVMKGIRALNIGISQETFDYFIDRTGYIGGDSIDLKAITIYLKQLSFCESEVTKEDIESLIPMSEQCSSFALINCIANKDFDLLIKLADISEGEPIATLSLVLRSFRIALKCKSYNPKEIGLSSYQMRSVSPLLSYPEEVLISSMNEINSGIELIKNGMPARSSYLSTLGILHGLLSE